MLSRLIDLVFPPRESELLVRSGGLLPYAEPRVCQLESCDVVALLPYEVPVVRAHIVETKFHGNEIAAKALGAVLASYLREECVELDAYEQRAYRLVPVPLSRERVKERGYNQVEMVAKYTDMEVDTNLLVRVRDTLQQTTLDGILRRQNLRGAFVAARMPDPSVTYFVIDDVITTGATISEAVNALYAAGARDVRAVALAH